MVIEFKRADSKRSPEASLHAGIEQIKDNRYGMMFGQTRSLYRVVMVISTKDKTILKDFCREVF